MATTLQLEGFPLGLTVTGAREGGQVQVRTQGFVSTEDGDQLVELLDQISDCWLARLPNRPRESAIDHFVMIFRRDRSVEIHINEVNLHARTQLKTDVQAGEPVRLDAVADLQRLELVGVDVPDDAGVLILLSARWRRGVLFDFWPLAEEGRHRDKEEFERRLAGAYTYLLFQDRVGLKEEDWGRLGAAGWFPFVGLPTSRVKQMRQHARAGWPVDDLLPKITADTHASLARLRDMVQRGTVFEGHRKVVVKALDHFEQGDYLSVAALLYPRIEGLLRSHHALVAPTVKATQSALAASAVADPAKLRHEWSLLLPDRFEDYLRETYFANFDPAAPAGVGRNTVGHGVAPETELGEKAAVVAVLIVEQLAFMCASGSPPI